MKVIFDDEHNEFIVTTSRRELVKAFTDEHELRTFLHELVRDTYGEVLANALFPL